MLAIEEGAKKLVGSTLETKSVHLQTEYLRTRRKKVTVHGIPVDITGNRLGVFFFAVRRCSGRLGDNEKNEDSHWEFCPSGDID